MVRSSVTFAASLSRSSRTSRRRRLVRTHAACPRHSRTRSAQCYGIPFVAPTLRPCDEHSGYDRFHSRAFAMRRLPLAKRFATTSMIPKQTQTAPRNTAHGYSVTCCAPGDLSDTELTSCFEIARDGGAVAICPEKLQKARLLVGSVLVVVADIFAHESLQMPFIEHDHMVQQVAAAASYPTCDSILPRTAKRGRTGSVPRFLTAVILDRGVNGRRRQLIVPSAVAREYSVKTVGMWGRAVPCFE